mmetsp:Transcript_19336/g.34539  ORF Transcript_19336/g.34539 Transcript_19336/m.34539 type:complete len:88 (+) Transcript_19336:1047-1310(+)
MHSCLDFFLQRHHKRQAAANTSGTPIARASTAPPPSDAVTSAGVGDDVESLAEGVKSTSSSVGASVDGAMVVAAVGCMECGCDAAGL